MKKSKVTFTDEKKVEKRILKDIQFNCSNNAENPIVAKLKTFSELRKNITFKDLF